MSEQGRSTARGFSLMEVVIAMGVLGVVIPLVLALIVVGGQGSRKASDDTKSAFIARSTMQELRFASVGKGAILREEVPWPNFPENGERYLLLSDEDGRLLRQVDSAAYGSGVNEKGVSYLVSIRGVQEQLVDLPSTQALSKVEVSIEWPAVAPFEKRRRKVFTQLMTPDV